ncbi:DNA-binding protein [Rhodococcus sp. KBS0724]|uniref:helix-turn-helix transcriptional regulator n=1 Tax=Rhodococcus sp. KBS0724 TaxID=1179674 RepID=UPI0028C3AFDA|nr:DNA-binding protein [Rhodococcus sp. KBS0724]
MRPDENGVPAKRPILTIAPDGDEFWQAPQCQIATGAPKGTWLYWAHIGKGPVSFKLGRRRVWRKSVILAWIAEQEAAGIREREC